MGTADNRQDGALVHRASGGDADAFGILVTRHQQALFRFALGMVADGDVAEDIVQEGFVRGYERIAECRNPDGFRSWMYRIVRNRCLDHLKNRRRRDVPLDSAPPIVSPHDAAADAEGSALGNAIRSALEALPEAQREAFLLKHVDELSYDEIAEVVDASVSALKMRVARAREALQTALRDVVEPAM